MPITPRALAPIAPCRFLKPFKKPLLCFLAGQQHFQELLSTQRNFPSALMHLAFHQGPNHKRDLAVTYRNAAQKVAVKYPEFGRQETIYSLLLYYHCRSSSCLRRLKLGLYVSPSPEHLSMLLAPRW